MQIQKNIQLQTLNTMATPAVAKWFTVLQSEEESVDLMSFCLQKKCDFLVIGEGSNSVFINDLNTLVIANRIGGAGTIPDLFQSQAVSKVSETSQECELTIGAGVNWHQLVTQSLQQGYFGLERLALIPGLVGAAPIQNIGAYGSEVSDVLKTVRAYDTRLGKFVELSKDQCQFAYRDSIFKKNAGRFIITEVTLGLQKHSYKYSHESLYPALQQQFDHLKDEKNIDARDVYDAVCHVRQSKLPSPLDIPNAGSFFKNPIVSEQHFQILKTNYPTLVNYCVPGGVKLAAGWLIEQLGLKGKVNESGISCYEKQALVIVNPEKKQGQDVLMFANYVQEEVIKHFNVELEIEPRLYQTKAQKLVCSS